MAKRLIPPLFIRKARAAAVIRSVESDTYFESMELTVRDIVTWETIQRLETSEERAKYDPGTDPSIILSVLRVVAITQTMVAGDVSAVVAGAILDGQLEQEYARQEAENQKIVEHNRQYAGVRKILDSLGPKS